MEECAQTCPRVFKPEGRAKVRWLSTKALQKVAPESRGIPRQFLRSRGIVRFPGSLVVTNLIHNPRHKHRCRTRHGDDVQPEHQVKRRQVLESHCGSKLSGEEGPGSGRVPC